ncbi:unnamed protein product [Mytilus coruscus]|uniref:Uncharacterized protein n=1 Tax=Mytilus coruscus TaxID=42192 RepID=A0A6J8DQZ7_MYTCO|nr:unnamed protein product [Mytilus coruscus]
MVFSTYCQYATTCKCKRFPKKYEIELRKPCKQKPAKEYSNNVNYNTTIADKMVDSLILKTENLLKNYDDRPVAAVSKNHRSSSQSKLPVFKKGKRLNSLQKNVAEGLKVFYYSLTSMGLKEAKLKNQKPVYVGEIRDMKNDILFGLCLLSSKVKISRKKSWLTTWKKLSEYQAESIKNLQSLEVFLRQVKIHSKSVW